MARKFRRKRVGNFIIIIDDDSGQWQSLHLDQQVLIPKRGIRATGRTANTQRFQWKERLFAGRIDPLLKKGRKYSSSFFLDYFLSTTLLLRIYQSSWDIFGGYIPNWKAWSVIFKFKRYCIYTVDIPPYVDELWLYILNSNFDLSNGRYCSSIYSRSLN